MRKASTPVSPCIPPILKRAPRKSCKRRMQSVRRKDRRRCRVRRCWKGNRKIDSSVAVALWATRVFHWPIKSISRRPQGDGYRRLFRGFHGDAQVGDEKFVLALARFFVGL